VLTDPVHAGFLIGVDHAHLVQESGKRGPIGFRGGTEGWPQLRLERGETLDDRCDVHGWLGHQTVHRLVELLDVLADLVQPALLIGVELGQPVEETGRRPLEDGQGLLAGTQRRPDVGPGAFLEAALVLELAAAGRLRPLHPLAVVTQPVVDDRPQHGGGAGKGV
jgi:hypothetical protein